MPTIDKGRLKRFLSKKVHLVSGKGAGANGTIDVCVVQATDWLVGRDGKSDSPSCVDPVIRGFAIRLNDAGAFSQWRDELKPFAARLANTNQGHALTRKRRFACADWAIREIAPLAIDACGKAPELAAELRALHEMLLSFLDAHEARSKQVHAVVMARLGIPLGFAKVEGAPRFLEVTR